ncbi:hypothetical protein [Sphaerotilus microaerophilus]|uniref:Uncharacterized protein n=1 Tax=Sphaerotilus microaerophilus TaxID=2914710 RepID=A0ABM7YMV4_9BURK|nr:hypothetical protein [Sphaerotilus sp. FB-5]BDI05762.1 hypothetical protein CATMQ487_27320 [Sphaerotilus sp. FB-5]
MPNPATPAAPATSTSGSRWLLRVEGVNLANCIDDTEDLSTRRGGSLMLLQAVETLADARAFGSELRPIKTGASAGLFEVLPGTDPQRLRERVADHLGHHRLYGHGTFVVDVAEAETFCTASDAVLNANRWRQMQSLTLSPIGLADDAPGACKVDERRPAGRRDIVKGEPAAVSRSVAERRSHGRDHKQDLYERELGQLPEGERPTTWNRARFTRDFEELAQAPTVPVEPASLVGKIGVFYADGNGFGKRVRALQNAEEVRAWEQHYTHSRRRFLAALIDRAAQEPRWQTRDGQLRLETLLWGGDELMLVAPGWCALELAEVFFTSCADLRWPADAPPEQADARLTHACGLVLCHQQAPISGIARLAKRLAEQGKAPGRNDDTLHWMLLENFDQAGGDLGAHLATRYPGAGLSWASLELSPTDLASLRRHMPRLQSALPRSAMLRAVRLLAEHVMPDMAAHTLLRRSYLQVDRAAREQDASAWRACWQAVHPAGRPWPDDWPALDHPTAWADLAPSADLAAWVTLLELWDYVAGTADASSGGDQ